MRAEHGTFASRVTGRKGLTEFYSGSLAYKNLGRELQSGKQYGKGYTEITGYSFWKCAKEPERKVSDNRDRNPFLWAAPTPLCGMQSKADPQYLKKDKKETESGEVKTASQLCSLVLQRQCQNETLESTSYYKRMLLETSSKKRALSELW